MTYHGIGVLGGLLSAGVELEAVLNLLLQHLTKLLGGLLGKVVDSAGNGTLVGEVSGNATLVLGVGLADEGTVVDETELGSVALGLEGAEQGLLSTENLQSRGRVLGQVGQTSSLLDQAGSNNLSNQSSQVRGDGAHLLGEVVVQRPSVLGELNDAAGEGSDVLEIGFGNFATHGDLGLVDDLRGLLLIFVDQGSQLVQLVLAQGSLVANVQSHASKSQVVGNNGVQLGEVPRVGFSELLGEQVDTLVQVVEGCNSTDD